MTISSELIRDSIALLSKVQGKDIKPQALIADVVMLAKVFPVVETFVTAIEETERELNFLISGKKKGHELYDNHAGILSLSYQSVRRNNQEADLRIAYDKDSKPIRVRAFGHRWTPQSFYSQLNIRKKEEGGWT